MLPTTEWMNAYWKSASKLCSGKTGLPAAVDWKSVTSVPCRTVRDGQWRSCWFSWWLHNLSFISFMIMPPSCDLPRARPSCRHSWKLMARGEGPWVHLRPQWGSSREGDGGGEEELTHLTFIGTHTHMPSALSDTLHIWYLLVKKKNNSGRGGERKGGPKWGVQAREVH